jgi:hypothetical protein
MAELLERALLVARRPLMPALAAWSKPMAALRALEPVLAQLAAQTQVVPAAQLKQAAPASSRLRRKRNWRSGALASLELSGLRRTDHDRSEWRKPTSITGEAGARCCQPRQAA